MSARLHRIGVAVHDLDAAIKFYSKLFNGNFTRTGEAVSKAAGVAVAADWSIGIELVQPVKGSPNPVTPLLEKFLNEHGEGVFAVGIRVSDIDAALACAERAGIKPLLPTFAFTPEQLEKEFVGAYTKFEETVLDTREQCGITWAFNIIEDAKP